MKILWFCNVIFSDAKFDSTGTWLHVMANALVETGEIQLFNISQARVKHTKRQDYKSFIQWIVPAQSLKNNGLPNSKTIHEIQAIVADIEPDIIHIWGTESYWGLLTARGYIKGNVILEIQGLKFVIAKYLYSGMTFKDILRCIGLIDFVKPYDSLIGTKYSFIKWGKFEKEMLLKHRYISIQSDWVFAYIKNINSTGQILNTSIMLRPEFLKSVKWEAENCIPYQIFTSASSISSYKGLHILIDAIAILIEKYPQMKLFLAGSTHSGLRETGYSKWIKKKIKNIGFCDNIFWLGPLDAEKLIYQMLKANVVVVPSFVESYCLSLDEALTVGTPTVASFAGAMPELATHLRSALYFSPGDVIMCANAIERLFIDTNFAKELSLNAYIERRKKSNANIAISQLTTYRTIFHEE